MTPEHPEHPIVTQSALEWRTKALLRAENKNTSEEQFEAALMLKSFAMPILETAARLEREVLHFLITQRKTE
jgi:hypothetical protein